MPKKAHFALSFEMNGCKKPNMIPEHKHKDTINVCQHWRLLHDLYDPESLNFIPVLSISLLDIITWSRML